MPAIQRIRLHPAIHAAALLALALFASGLSGCKIVQATAELPGEAVRAVGAGEEKEVQADPALLQQDVFRFCDEYTNRMSAEFDRLLRREPGFPDSDLVRLKLSLHYRMLEIAAGPNDYVNLCDLVCLVALSRHSIEAHWIPNVLGEAGRPALERLKEYERQIYELASASLGEEARKRLRESVTAWLESTYEPGMALYTRYTGLSTAVVQKVDASQSEKTTLLSTLMLDPLAGLDPTVREIAQTRLFAERAMFVAQRMPKVLRMELELVSFRLIENPEITRLLADLSALSESVDRVSRVAEALPGLVQSEREAVLKALDQQSPELTRMVSDARAAVEASAQAMIATNNVVQSTDHFLERLGVYDKPAAPPPGTAGAAAAAPPSEPFRIQDYTAAAAQLAQSAERLNTLVVTLDHTLATATSPEVAEKVTAASQAAIASGRELTDYVFWRAMILLLSLGVAVPVVVLVCRRLGRPPGPDRP